MHMPAVKAAYIWLDGCEPVSTLRSKTKILNNEVNELSDLPDWGFDGSSTEQASGSDSDCVLKPVRFVKDPLRGAPHILVMCEVLDAQGMRHPSNKRAALRKLAEKTTSHEPWFGIEQEYTLFKEGRPLGWPEPHSGYPGPQGPYYCGVGAERVYGRELIEEHLEACLQAGLTVSGINAEVMPGQWEYQIGPLGALEVSDEIWLSRWILERLGEKHGIAVSLEPKPVTGDWNGAGAHTNFSTKAMREEGGLKVIEEAIEKLRVKHGEHIAAYGPDNDKRLTGQHETAPITEFKAGVSDRGASIRIPLATTQKKRGYLEDRRPAANMDPYKVCAKLLETICN